MQVKAASLLERPFFRTNWSKAPVNAIGNWVMVRNSSALASAQPLRK
jgi:hypothetical protein